MKQHISRADRQNQKRQLEKKKNVEESVLRFSQKRFKKMEEIVDAINKNIDLSNHYSDRRIWKIHECFQKFSTSSKLTERNVLAKTFMHLCKHSDLITGEDYIGAVFNMVRFRAYWINDPTEWKPGTRRAADQVRVLAEWLFCKYKTPEFLHKAFYGTGNDRYIIWFLHLGTGGRVKELTNMPIPFTQKMGHYFLQSPVKFSIQEAIRWCQVRGLGGESKLAERITYSWLGTKPFEDEIFWESFIQLLVKTGMFNHDKLTELIDFVREERRLNTSYSLKGRTLQSLVRQSDTWHKRFSHYNDNMVWKPCGLTGFREEKKKELILIEELNETALLKQEGKTMKHCVASYAFYCAKGRTAIFSLREYSGGVLLDVLATIEVNLQLKRIVQAKAKMNRPINDKAKKYMIDWAERQSLSISPYL